MEGHQRTRHHPPPGLSGGGRPSRSTGRTVQVLIGITALASAGLTATAILVGEPLRRLARSWEARVAIAGRSMEPGLDPGDWLLVDPDAYRWRSPLTGELVLAPDPREPSRLLVKRVTTVEDDGTLRLAGDASDASTDSRSFGSIDPATVLGRPTFRYWPPGRVGRVF